MSGGSLSFEEVSVMLLANAWFDVHQAPGYRASGVPEDQVQRYRFDHGWECVKSPEATAELREWRDGHGDDWDPFVSSHSPSGFGIWVKTTEDIRRLGKRVQDGDRLLGAPTVMLLEDQGNRPPERWFIVGGEMSTEWRRSELGWISPACTWRTDLVTDDGIQGHGPWRVVWSRGVKW